MVSKAMDTRVSVTEGHQSGKSQWADKISYFGKFLKNSLSYNTLLGSLAGLEGWGCSEGAVQERP